MAVVPKPTAKPDAAAISAIKTKTLATQAAQKGFGAGTGGVNSALNPPGGTPSGGCGAGTPSGAPGDAADNQTMGPTTNAPGSLSGPTAGVNPAVQNMVRNSVPAGCRAQVTPHGGVGTRSVSGSAHPRGLATDTNLYCGGRQQFAGSPQMNQYIQNLNANGARGLSYYNSGFVHSDLMGQRQRRWGPNQGYVNSATKGENPGPGAAQAAGGGTDGGGGDPCSGGSGGGCQPIQSSAPQIASGLGQNLGMDVPSMVQGLAQGLMSGNPMGAIMGQIQGALGGLMGQAQGMLGGMLGKVGLGGLPLSPAALADPTSAITKLVGDKVAGIGANIMPSITGNLPGPMAQAAGMAQGMVANKVTETANLIMAKNSPPKLDRFISIFNAANSAQSFSSDLQETVGNTLNNVFGNARERFNNPTTNNWVNNSAFTYKENPYARLNDAYIGEVTDAVETTIGREDFIGDPETVLARLQKIKQFNAFASMFYDWDAFVTRGYGTITNNVIEFGTDLIGLGKLADLNDILRIGTPGQIAQQIIRYGGGATTGLFDYLHENGLMQKDLFDKENDPMIAEFLLSIADTETIDFVKNILELDPELELETLGDLLDTQVILPLSNDYNYFNNLNDIAVFLSMCNGGGRLTTLNELGKLIESFEVPFDSTHLTGDPAIYSYEELTNFVNEYAPVGHFTYDGSLSVADFIGSAAGYIHESTFPRIANIQKQLYNDTDYFNEYYALLEVLKNALEGSYRVPGIAPALPTVVVPDTTNYSFGTYASLDAAITAIVGAVESELQDVIDAIGASGDDELIDLLRELDSLHTESSMQLAREHKLRKHYGFKLGPTKSMDQFIGDGVTKVLPLSNDIDEEDDFNVFVNGVWQSPSSYTVNTTTNKITLGTAPAQYAKITVNYKTGAFNGIANPMQVWEFASSLENYALDTGYGRSADFLRRLVTNDVHGQRILAAMMNARNRVKSEAVGLNCPNFETVNGAAPTYINYTEWTNVWAYNATRAGEIWLQLYQDVDSSEQYLLRNLAQNRMVLEPELELLRSNTVRQLLFFSEGNLVMSDLLADLYQQNPNAFAEDREDLYIGFADEMPTEGYILGPYKEILSHFTSKEGIKNDVFTSKISDETEYYLKSIGIDLNSIVTFVQRVLSVNLSQYMGITEANFRDIFGVQSVSKTIMYNIANNY